jgi:hypothetical protein
MYGAAESPDWDSFHACSKFFRQKSPKVGSQYGAATEAGESLTAQSDSQSKHTTPRRENRKIRQENEILKQKNMLLKGYQLYIYRMTPKEHTSKSRETIPLNLVTHHVSIFLTHQQFLL